MVELSLNQIALYTDGRILQGPSGRIFRSFNIDSRLIRKGDLFFAIQNQRNGHDFIPHAYKSGAGGAVICQAVPIKDRSFALIMVKDTLKALQELAAKVLQDHKVKVIGITGSIGKTTTKEFTAELLSSGFHVLKSEGNYNNYLGLPLSLLKLSGEHTAAVLEMGMSSPGEINTLTEIAPPDVAVITNIKPVHLEFFDSIEDIAQAKKEILDGLKPDGIAVLNGDDPLVMKIAEDWKGERVIFGFSDRCDIRAEHIQKNGWEGIRFDLFYDSGKTPVLFPFVYRSFLVNFLAAAGAAAATGIPLEEVAKKSASLKPLAMRGVVLSLKKGIKLVDDTYNSNPAGLESSLSGLSDLPAVRRVAVLGDMLELGEESVDFHKKAGEQVQKHGWDILITIGPLGRHIAGGALSAGMRENQILSFSDSEEAAQKIWPLLKEGDLVLVKASRGIKTEIIADKIKQEGS